MFVVPITKRMEVIISIHVYLISQMNIDYKENGGKIAFLTNAKINIVYPDAENLIMLPKTKIMGIAMSIQVCHISRMNFNYKKNGGKKSFPCQSKASGSCIPMWRI